MTAATRTACRSTPIIRFPGVWRGRNGVMLGDLTCLPLTLRGGSDAGDILVPCQICPVGPDGTFLNKGGGFTFHDSAVLHGRWVDGGPRLSWRLVRSA